MSSSICLNTSYTTLQYITTKLKESNKTQEDQYLQFIKLVKLFRYHKDYYNEDDSHFYIEFILKEFKDCYINRNVTNDLINYINEYYFLFNQETLEFLIQINNLPYELRIELEDAIFKCDYYFY